MTGKTHQAIGLTVGLSTYFMTASPHYEPATFAFVLVTSSLAALLPDLDQASSDIWQKLPFGRQVGGVVTLFLQHRNFSHSLLGTAVFAWIVHSLLAQAPDYWGVNTTAVFYVFIASYVSHLVADMVTVEGVPLLFPYQRMFGIPPRPFQGARIVTGKWFENLIVFPAVNIIFLMVVGSHWNTIHQVLFK